MFVAHPEGFSFKELCIEEDCIMVRYYHQATDFSSYVDVVPKHEWDTIPQLLAQPCDEQVRILKSVLRTLDEHVIKAIRTPHLVTATSRQNFCDDVAIWWLYEFFTGQGAEHVVLDLNEREQIRGLKASKYPHGSDVDPKS
jgi:hypothetical protein